MKRVLLLTATMTASLFAVEKKDVMPLIEEASAKRESAYVEVRNKITGYGKNTLPLLAEIAVDEALPWQQQLVARICYERIERGEEIKKLLETDWYSHPNFDPKWNDKHSGPEGSMEKIVLPDLKEIGLWHHYLEVIWKTTGEEGKISQKYIPHIWTMWYAFVLKDNLEERVWFLKICADLLEPSPPPYGGILRHILFNEKTPDTVPLLFRYFIQPTEKNVEIGPWFRNISKFADSRSADILEKYIAEHPSRASYKDDIATVRTRPAPPPAPDIFRLGTNIIKRAKQP